MTKQKRILIVDDDEDILIAGELLLKRDFGKVITCHTPEHIPAVMKQHKFDAVLLDMNFSPGERSGEQGFYWLQRILELDPDAVVVMTTAHGGVDVAVEAMKYGATDFICKPWQNEKVIATLSAAVQLHQSREEASQLKRSNQALVQASSGVTSPLLGRSASLQQVHSMIRRTAPTDANVLILGENGTGKELVARELHCHSLRSDQVFMSVDLGAVSETLFESELFGHSKGAFTGANKDRVGRLVAASGGTLFLDEIGNLPLHLQAKLLTVLERRKVTPLGSNQSIDIDIRVIAATNMPRHELNDDKQFRQDLLFRLNTVEILVPPLRDRGDDIMDIANYYAEHFFKKYRRSPKPFSVEAMRAARSYPWPGNVRALRHAVERAVILAEGERIETADLQLPSTSLHSASNHDSVTENTVEAEVKDAPGQAQLLQHSDDPGLMFSLDDLDLEKMDRRLVKLALEKHQNNISKAARDLGLTRATLYRRIEKYAL